MSCRCSSWVRHLFRGIRLKATNNFGTWPHQPSSCVWVYTHVPMCTQIYIDFYRVWNMAPFLWTLERLWVLGVITLGGLLTCQNAALHVLMWVPPTWSYKTLQWNGRIAVQMCMLPSGSAHVVDRIGSSMCPQGRWDRMESWLQLETHIHTLLPSPKKSGFLISASPRLRLQKLLLSWS